MHYRCTFGKNPPNTFQDIVLMFRDTRPDVRTTALCLQPHCVGRIWAYLITVTENRQQKSIM